MDLEELEVKGVKPEKSKPKEAKNNEVQPTEQVANVLTQTQPIVITRTATDWRLILKLSIVLSLLIGFLLGSVGGFFIGKSIYQNTSTQTNDGGSGQQESIYSQYDYTQFVINADKNITIQSFYNDDEERFFAMQLIGAKLPELKYLNSANEELSLTDLGDGKYILEFLEPDCAYCNKMITTVDAYRAIEGSLNVIGLSIKEGDISNFNKQGEHTFKLINKDEKTDDLVELIVWVPTFMYIENGTIKLVTFGNMKNVEEFQKNVEIAFN